ncbi:LacI family DNA-binding transcriptional regulator [Cohnella lupini]|uniref:LacI family transcriptional regulator n=1 Tax=Cohnella lupini TaxID=1294267 RepID=A0A3D9IT29_9BACL|nr:LacI family DNA-binding transcriptional regulator [Cohnella lupini]RED64845.1 LacI family transcriptional regulator [Cohnella lupini]
MATIRDVAKMSGFSVATVSRVLNKKGYVNAATEKSIVAAMSALNYTPSIAARSLAGKSSGTIALMVPDILNPFFPELARAIEDAANGYGYSVILCNSDNDLQKEMNYFDMLVSKKVDGLIVASYSLGPDQILNLKKRSIPVIAIDNHFGAHPIVSFVSDNRAGGAMATRHLLEQGCRKIAHICGPMSIVASRERCLGYEEACGTQPWFLPSLIATSDDFHVEGGTRAMAELLKRHPDIDGVFAGNDLMACGALKALYRLRRKVPEEIKLVGFDGLAMSTVVPELSTIAQPIREMGTQAMDYLIRMLNGERVEERAHVMDVTLVVKQSSQIVHTRG